jgi:hypothetical protein
MPRLKASDHVESLRRKRAEIDAQLKEAEEAENARHKETQKRRAELVGETALALAADDPKAPFAIMLNEALHTRIKRAADRALFPSLPAIGAKKPGNPSTDLHPPSEAAQAA